MHFSDYCVFHTTPEFGAYFTDLCSFAVEHPVRTISPGARMAAEYQALLMRCQRLRGLPYSVFVNCEDVANEVRYGVRRSPTRERLTDFTSLAVLICLALKR